MAGRFIAILMFGVGVASTASAQDCGDRLKGLVAEFPIIGTPSEIYRMSPGSFDASYGYAGAFGTALPVNVSVEQYRAAHGLPPPLSNGQGGLEQARQDRVDGLIVGQRGHFRHMRQVRRDQHEAIRRQRGG